MKVGTDGVLLGAWAPVDHDPFSVLDIGAGTGLIALMIAQRSAAQQIDALEIEESAYEECVENFEESPWADRLFCFHAGLDEFIEEPEDQYDLIVSNPPFYSEDYSSGNESRDAARLSASMPFEQLVQAAGQLMSEQGIFAVVLPYKEEAAFIALSEQQNLYPLKITRVRGTPASEVKRSLIAFSRTKTSVQVDEIAIETTRHQYTPEYVAMTKDFYLKL